MNVTSIVNLFYVTKGSKTVIGILILNPYLYDIFKHILKYVMSYLQAFIVTFIV